MFITISTRTDFATSEEPCNFENLKMLFSTKINVTPYNTVQSSYMPTKTIALPLQ